MVIEASVSGGYRATPGTAWPEQLDQRLQQAGLPLTMVKVSIGATKLLTRNDDCHSSALEHQQ
ncbi:SGNH/GDSL hydrolase family protein [Streptomyces chartreusis]|uniref:hypothetical protein n=1 Tax=Streptomyces chartreusis TaxID=1969 RepID=UPI00382ED361